MNRTFTFFFTWVLLGTLTHLYAQSSSNKDFFDPQSIQEINLNNDSPTRDNILITSVDQLVNFRPCGICTPGFLMASKSLLERNPNPTETEVRYWLAGNLCRCTGYDKIIAAVQDAAAKMRNA